MELGANKVAACVIATLLL